MKLFAQSILVGNEWQENKTIVIDKEGYIQGIHDGKTSGAECLDGAVIQGMVNCHSHAFQRAFAGLTEYRASKSDIFGVGGTLCTALS